MWMRGGTSKGGYFLAQDLPSARDGFLLRAFGAVERQIDGMGGADPLTSKAAVVRASMRAGADVDYLFLQVGAEVSSAQNCGNILAGVGPFAIERGLVAAVDGETRVRIFMENTEQMAEAVVQTPLGVVSYEGEAEIDGVPGQAAPVLLGFDDIEGANCGALLPTGNVRDVVAGVEVTLIDNGMPTVILRAVDMGISGLESRAELEANEGLRARLEAVRLAAGPMMNLGDVSGKTVPKMSMVSAPVSGGAINTRTFIPHRCHASIGVLGAVSVATACMLDGSVAAEFAVVPDGARKALAVEHPIGQNVIVFDESGRAQVLRTARKLFDGVLYG